MKILICNVGSTSLKYQLLDMADGEKSLAQGKQERVGSQQSTYSHSDLSGKQEKGERPLPDHGAGIELMMSFLVGGVVKNLDEIACVGFKVVHAKGVTGVQRLDEPVLKAMEDFNCIAPSHNPPYIAAIRQFAKLMPGVPLIGSFETGFHANIPPKAYLYSIPKELHKEQAVRRYGFHGASHEYVSGRVAQLMGREDLRIITCHLGGSGSLCAIKNGVSIDTTLGFSLQCGIMHNNRCGDIDPYIPFYLMEEMGYTPEQVKDMLNKQSGFLGMSGISGDLRDIEQAAEQGNVDAINTIDSYAYNLKKYIGSYAAALGGVDAIAFSGGIGENSPIVRRLCLEDTEFLGIQLDLKRNELCRPDSEISQDNSPVKIFVIGTNEELIVARKAAEFLAG